MDLQTEYTRRHGINTVVPTPDSYLMFRVGKDLFVVMMAHRPRTSSYCAECSSGLMAIELWSISPDGMGLFTHSHINPDQDIIEKIKEFNHFGKEKIELIRFKGEEDLIDTVWRALGGKGKNAKEEMFSAVRDDDMIVPNFALIMSTITFRKQPLLFDVIRDT